MQSLDALRGRAYNSAMKIIVPIAEKTESEILAAAESIDKNAYADIIEWRADFTERPMLEILTRLKKICAKPVIFTYRSKDEGGRGAPQPREALLEASEIADYTDFEFRNFDFLKDLDPARKSIISRHDFYGTPPTEELIKLGKEMLESNAGIIKIAVTPKDNGDVLALLNAARCVKAFADARRRETIFISMGRLGVVSRVFPELFASDYTFASLGKTSAPGQISVENLAAVRDLL
jgi:3-dehydroquinate dehydratase-1